jgi:hypothetical protein
VISSAAEESRNDAGIAPDMEHRHHLQWFFIRCVHDQKIPHGMKPQRPRRQIDTTCPISGNETNCVVNFVQKAICGVWTVCRYEFPDLLQVCKRVSMEYKSARECQRFRFLPRK